MSPIAEQLTDRVALVTGASSGLGAQFARVLRRAGADVVVTARRHDRLDHLAAEIGLHVVTGDIQSAAHRQQLSDAIRDRFGRLDILVNNAGVCDDGPLAMPRGASLVVPGHRAQ
jgi:NADP-dependent 3-hydroxy acid dehydrogenase YdfG